MAGEIAALTRIVDRIMNMDRNHTFDRTTDSLEALSFSIGIGPGTGLWMFGIVDATQVASQVTVITNNLPNIPTDLLEGQFWMQVINNTSAPATAPEGEFRNITAFVQGGALQTFTVDAFSANVEAGDMVAIFHEAVLSIEVLATGTLTTSSLTVPADTGRTEGADYFKGAMIMAITGAARFQPRPIRSNTALGVFTLDEPFTILPGLVDYIIVRSSYPMQRLIDIFNLVNAQQVLTETGGTLTTTGAEQTIYTVGAPAGIFEPTMMLLDSTNLVLGLTIVVRTFYRVAPPGAGLIPMEAITFVGPGDPEFRLKEIPLKPNRFGFEVTLEQTVGAVGVDFNWEVIYKV